jgi:hypothetical protein
VQQRFKLSLSQYREACMVISAAAASDGAKELSGGKVVAGTEKRAQPVLVVDVKAALVAEGLL